MPRFYPANIQSRANPELSGCPPKRLSEAGLLPDYPTGIQSRAVPGLSGDYPKLGFSWTIRLTSEVGQSLTPETAQGLSTKAKTYIFNDYKYDIWTDKLSPHTNSWD